jgi:hypothetical protein
LCAKERIFVYKLDSFVGFIGDEQLHAQECHERQPFEHREMQLFACNETSRVLASQSPPDNC